MSGDELYLDHMREQVRRAQALQGDLNALLPQQRYLYAQGQQWVPLHLVREAWANWKKAWSTGDSEEAYALMEMDTLLGVDAEGNETF